MRRVRLPGQVIQLLLVLAAAGLPISAAAAPDLPAVCHRLEDREPPASDRPTPAQLRALKGCNAEALYYGEAGPVDYARARACAFKEEADGKGGTATQDVFAGPTILMQLYANGLGGVKRDLDQASAYACAIEAAPAEIESRMQHLQSLKIHPEAKRFDYCDDITSGLAGGFCAARNAEIAKKGRAAKNASLQARVPPNAQPTLAALRKASAAFVDARGAEVDRTGTARAQMEIDDEERSRSAFTGHLAQLLNGRWPPATAAQAKAADDALNAAYQKAMAFLGSADNGMTVKPEDARSAQRAWIAYRDAFVRFAQAAAPSTSPKAVAAVLTRERVKALEGLVY